MWPTKKNTQFFFVFSKIEDCDKIFLFYFLSFTFFAQNKVDIHMNMLCKPWKEKGLK
jgi:hypothetical protein